MLAGVRRVDRIREGLGKRVQLIGRWPVPGYPTVLAPVPSAPSERLLDIAVHAVDGARRVNLDEITARLRRLRLASSARLDDRPSRSARTGAGAGTLHSLPRHPDAWPGQHYKLLVALVALLRPTTVIELGTATGMSALTMKAVLPADGKIVTFDLVRWQEYPAALLSEDDFADGRLEQRLDDLSTPAGWQRNADLLRQAEFIFVDAMHNGEQERNFVRGFDQVGLASCPIVMFDDIRLWRMLRFWREISRPKLDITSFGHWSGTGLVDYA